jgi:hypothetical protein
MDLKTLNNNLYLINFALLFTHEIDSAFWKEWELFHLPGGIQGFLIANFILLIIALYGFMKLVSGEKTGRIFALLLSGGGVFAFIIHSYFILTGHGEFTLPVSLGLLFSTLIVSAVQGYLMIKTILSK